MNEQQMKQWVLDTSALLEGLASTTPEQLDQLQSLANQVVGLRDTGKFRMRIDLINRGEIVEARRALASAIAVENWWSGFMTCLQIIAMLAPV